MRELSGIGKAYRAKLSRVLEQHPNLLTPSVVAQTLEVSAQEAGRLLSRWNDNGWVHRVKRGVYVPASLSSTSTKPIIEEPFLIADSLYAPGYVGGFSAVKHWDFSDQITETTTYFTRKVVKDRNPTHAGVRLRLKTVTEKRFFALKPIWIGSRKILVSDPTKTMVDILDDPKLVGGMTMFQDIFSEYFESEHYSFQLLVDYARRNGNKTVFKRLGLLLEIHFPVGKTDLDVLRKEMSKGYSSFDPGVPGLASVPEWRLKTSESWKAAFDRKK